jgi:hypothetical protein
MNVGPVTPASGLAVAAAATAPQPTSDVAAIAAQLVAEIAETLTENLPAPAQPPALTAMVAAAATQQQGLAPLLADLGVAVNASAPPDAARATAAQILTSQTPLGPDVTAQALRSAAQNSGVFLEATLAASVLNQASAPNLLQDLKALLTQLSSDLAPFVEAPEQAKAAAAATSSVRAPQVRTDGEPLEPPVGGGATSGQAASRPSFGPGAQVETLARALQQGAQGALARIQLSQAASVPRAGEPARWMFEVPIATPEGAGVAQFEISRDGRGPGGGPAEPSWRARFSVNVAPSGPVHADVLLGAGRARVTLMAEDEAARQALEAHQSELTEALAAEQGSDVAVRIVGGAPPRPQQPPGQLLDRRS